MKAIRYTWKSLDKHDYHDLYVSNLIGNDMNGDVNHNCQFNNIVERTVEIEQAKRNVMLMSAN